MCFKRLLPLTWWLLWCFCVGACCTTCRSYGVLGTATKLLSVGSNITSAITGTSAPASGSSTGGAGERVGNVGQGIVKGTLTFGGGLIKGVTGIVADPVAGAKQGGMRGFMTGVGKGLVGVPGQIIGGALSAASQVTEGLDASVSKVGPMRCWECSIDSTAYQHSMLAIELCCRALVCGAVVNAFSLFC